MFFADAGVPANAGVLGGLEELQDDVRHELCAMVVSNLFSAQVTVNTGAGYRNKCVDLSGLLHFSATNTNKCYLTEYAHAPICNMSVNKLKNIVP